MQRIITDAEVAKIKEMSLAGYTNRQIATDLNMKHSTLCSWKAKIRKGGFKLPDLSGRPAYAVPTEASLKQPPYKKLLITTTEDFARMNKEEQEALVKAKLAEIMASLTTDPSAPQA